MINPQITTAASTNLNKSDLKQGSKPTNTSSTLKESLLAKALGKNLAPTSDTQTLTSSDESLNLKLKSLVNKVLDQLFSRQTPNQRLAAQQERLNFAPNFSNELKTLAAQMQKSPALSELASKLDAILKPASEVKAENFAPLFKNSGVFFEAKLKDALNENSLPKSFHSLLNAIKSLSSPQISAQIVELADKDLSPKASLDELKGILSAQKGENQAQLGSTSFKTLLALGEKLENFKNYISKNPQNAQNKLTQIASNILKALQKLEPSFKQELARPENLALKNTSVLKELNQAFFKLTNTLKALINGESIAEQNLLNSAQNQGEFFQAQNQTPNSPQNPTNPSFYETKPNTPNLNENSSENKPSANLNSKSPTPQDFDDSPTLSKPENSATSDTKSANLNENKPSISAQNADEGEIQTNQNKNETAQKGENLKGDTKQNALNLSENANKTQESPKNAQNLQGKENATNSAKNATQNAANSSISQANSAQQNAANLTKANSTNSNLNQANSNQPQNPINSQNTATQTPQNAATTQNNTTQNLTNPQNTAQNSPNFANLTAQENALNANEQAKFAQNQVKNLVFADENAQMPELEALNKELSALARKAGEGLKQLDGSAQNAKQNLNDIRNLERKIEQASRDLSKIAPKNATELSESLKNDIKSTLLQVSQLAKSEGNEAVANQANRMLAQIEFNQLMSLANDSINTYLPLFWEDLSESRVIFKRGKKDKYYAQIKLNFAKLGELDILIALRQDKYLDINIMAQDVGFRQRIYEHSHELRRALNKAGLLSANFFVGDIVRSKPYESEPARDYDFEMGIDKRA